MLSNYLLNQQKVILIKDQLGIESSADKIVKTWLRDGKGPDAVLQPATTLFEQEQFLFARVSQLIRTVYAPSLFKFVHHCKQTDKVQYLFLWATKKNIPEDFVVPYLEYQSELIVTLEDERHLSILVKKSGGSVSNKRYQYQLQEGSFSATELKGSDRMKQTPATEPPSIDPASLVTFSIGNRNKQEQEENLNPYEFYKETSEGGRILYHPDALDDLDEEDPDDDLLI